MSKSRQTHDEEVLVRFWSLDHHRAETMLWPTSPWPKLVFAKEGTLHVETSRQLHVLPSTRALYVPAGERHPARSLGRASVRTLYFSPTLAVDREPGILEVRPLLRELIAETCATGPLLRHRERDRAISALLMDEIQQSNPLASSIPMPRAEWLRGWAAGFLQDPAAEPPTGYSQRTLERKVLAETRLTLGQWRQQARLLVGLQELSQGATVLEASIAAGYETASGFIQSFRRHFGTTPGRIFSSAGDEPSLRG